MIQTGCALCGGGRKGERAAMERWQLCEQLGAVQTGMTGCLQAQDPRSHGAETQNEQASLEHMCNCATLRLPALAAEGERRGQATASTRGHRLCDRCSTTNLKRHPRRPPEDRRPPGTQDGPLASKTSQKELMAKRSRTTRRRGGCSRRSPRVDAALQRRSDCAGTHSCKIEHKQRQYASIKASHARAANCVDEAER